MAGWRGGGLHLDKGQNQQKLSEGKAKETISQLSSVSPILFAVARCEGGGQWDFLLPGCERLWLGQGQA